VYVAVIWIAFLINLYLLKRKSDATRHATPS